MSLGFISDSGFTLVIGHRSNDELICVMVGAGGKNLKIDVPTLPEKKKTGRKPGPSNVESLSLSKTKDFIQSVHNAVMNDLNPDIELKEYGITESNFGRIVREAKARIQKKIINMLSLRFLEEKIHISHRTNQSGLNKSKIKST